MSGASKSLLVYSIYTLGLGLTLLLVPNIPLPIFGLPEAHEVWIRVTGMTVIFLSIFYFIAGRNDLAAAAERPMTRGRTQALPLDWLDDLRNVVELLAA